MTSHHDVDWRRAARHWLPVLLWMLLIYVASNQSDLPAARSGGLDFLVKKSAHLAEYTILGLLVWRALRATWPAARFWLLGLATVGVGLLYAVSDEMHQIFVPTRQSRPLDVLVDLLGLLAAVLLLRLSRRL